VNDADLDAWASEEEATTLKAIPRPMPALHQDSQLPPEFLQEIRDWDPFAPAKGSRVEQQLLSAIQRGLRVDRQDDPGACRNTHHQHACKHGNVRDAARPKETKQGETKQGIISLGQQRRQQPEQPQQPQGSRAAIPMRGHLGSRRARTTQSSSLELLSRQQQHQTKGLRAPASGISTEGQSKSVELSLEAGKKQVC